jgi:hypothetical protein
MNIVEALDKLSEDCSLHICRRQVITNNSCRFSRGNLSTVEDSILKHEKQEVLILVVNAMYLQANYYRAARARRDSPEDTK